MFDTCSFITLHLVTFKSRKIDPYLKQVVIIETKKKNINK